MNPAPDNLAPYLRHTLGIEVVPAPWPCADQLPFHLRDTYTFHEVQLLGVSCLLMQDHGDVGQSPASIRKHLDMVGASWSGELVYVRERVTAYNRKRLIEHKVPFVIPGNQMYLPLLGIDFREHFRTARLAPDKFSPSTQVLIINLLLRGTRSAKFSPSEMAEQLGYSTMTMTRAFNELESAGLGEIFQKGRERILRFHKPESHTWQKAQPYLRSPVRKRIFIDSPDTRPPGLHAGLTALANYTMLSAPFGPVVALGARDWASVKQDLQSREIPYAEPGAWEIQVWSYDPGLCAADNTVDRLSLYLSLKDDRDERVEDALEEMVKGLAW
jgi:hypothetical protein